LIFRLLHRVIITKNTPYYHKNYTFWLAIITKTTLYYHKNYTF